MKTIKNIFISLHKYLGTILSLMFLVWFLSGFVLIYAGFPRVSPQKHFSSLENLTPLELGAIQLPDSSFSGRVELEKMNGIPVWKVYKGRVVHKLYNATSNTEIHELSEEKVIQIAEKYSDTKLERIEKYKQLDQWVPWSAYQSQLPFCLCYMSDEADTRLYVSLKTGSVIQETTLSSRWAARLGAIPHWIYFKSLRLKTGLWLEVVTWISLFGVLASSTGLVVGFVRLRKRRKTESWTRYSPYKKFWYKWHHITGFLFGIFVFTFILSGMISVSGIPNCLVPVHEKVSPRKLWNQQVQLSHFPQKINFSKLAESAKPIKKIVWKTVMGEPCLWVYRERFDLPEVYLTDSKGFIKRKKYSKRDIESWMKKVCPQKKYLLKSQCEYNAFYQKHKTSQRPLPVWQIDMCDQDQNTLYIHPETGELIQSYNSNDRWRRWLYRALHTFDFPFLTQYEWLRKLLLIILSVGGTLVSITGLVLAVKWIRRSIRN